MAKKRVLSQKLREEIISYTKKEMATKRFPRHLKFQKTQLAESYASLKIHGTAANLAGHGRFFQVGGSVWTHGSAVGGQGL